ncbi:MAG: tellurite resistance TerB family protein [Pseudomonadota bacterium]
MGLFSNLRKATGAKSVADDTARAVIAMPIMVAAADGKLDRSEIDQIINMCAYSPIFHAVGAERTQKLIMECLETIKAKGSEALFTQVASTLSPQMAETALCFAIRTALADGHLDQSEKDMLMAMASRMGIEPDTFIKMFDVMVILQRPAAA